MSVIEKKAQSALAGWGLEGADITLVAQRENFVFRVNHAHGVYALRLHRPGYQSARMIKSELNWILHLGANGLNVPEPLPDKSGLLLQEVDGYQVDLLTWLAGAPMGATGTPLDLPDRQDTFRKMGRLMAEIHEISDVWAVPEGFERKSWDIEGLLGDTPLWGRFWENPGLGNSGRNRMLAARDYLRSDLANADLDFGLIHADMLRENILIDAGRLGLIDFDDSGFGFRLFDVATALIKNRVEPDFADLLSAFLNGYHERRPLDTTLLPQFMLIRELSYLGWIIPRMNEPDSNIRQARFLASAIPLMDEYLSTRGEVE